MLLLDQLSLKCNYCMAHGKTNGGETRQQIRLSTYLPFVTVVRLMNCF